MPKKSPSLALRGLGMQFVLNGNARLMGHRGTWMTKGCSLFSALLFSTKPARHSQELVDLFYYYGSRHIIPKMERLPIEKLQAAFNNQGKLDEDKVRFYLASDIKSKADAILQKHSQNLAMQIDLFCFHLRNKNTPAADDILRQILATDQSNETIVQIARQLLANDQYSMAYSLAYPRTNLSPEHLPLIKMFLSYYARKKMHNEAEQLIQLCKLSKITGDVEFYNLILCLSAQQKEKKKLEQTLEEMKQNELQLNVHSYNQLLYFYSNQADESTLLRECSEILYKMSNEQISFNDETFFILIKKMLRFCNFDQIFEVFDQIKKSNIPLSLETIRALSKEFGKSNLDAGIGLLMDHCDYFEIIPDMNLYNLWLEYLLRNFETDQALIVLHNATWANKVDMNGETFCVLLEHFASILEIDACHQIIKEMKRLNIPLGNSHNSALMSTFFFTYDRLTNPRVMQMLPFCQDSRWHLRKLTESRLLEPSTVQDTFEAMFGIPFVITIHSYNHLLIQALKTRQLNEFSAVYDNLFKNPNVIPNEITFLLKIKALLLAHDPAGATQVLREMEHCDIDPPTIAYALIFHYYCRKGDTVEAEKMLESFELANNFRVNFVFYSSLLYAYMKRVDYQKVISTFHRLESKYLVTDTETHNYLIEANFRLGQWEEGLRCWETMKTQGVPRNWFTYSILIFNLLRLDLVPMIYEQVLPDCMLPGNSISCTSFDRLFCYHINNSHMEAVERLILLMNQYEVRFNYSSIAFLSIALKGLVMKRAWQNIVLLLYKIATDFAPGNEYVGELFDHVILWLNAKNDAESSTYIDAVQRVRIAYERGLLLVPPANPIISFGYNYTMHD